MHYKKKSSLAIPNTSPIVPQVPEVYWGLTTERVLTMEFCEGGQINDKDYFTRNNINVNKVPFRFYNELWPIQTDTVPYFPVRYPLQANINVVDNIMKKLIESIHHLDN